MFGAVGAGDAVEEVGVGDTSQGFQGASVVLASEPGGVVRGTSDTGIGAIEIVSVVGASRADGGRGASQAGARTSMALLISVVQVVPSIARRTVEAARSILLTSSTVVGDVITSIASPISCSIEGSITVSATHPVDSSSIAHGLITLVAVGDPIRTQIA
jgi:hypothetical protein